MAIADNNIYNIYDGLKHNFLYENDINSIHILLNLYDLEENITNIYPKYISINSLKKHIGRFLKDKKGNHLISLNLGQLIHEDINRLELYIYLDGYKKGFYNKSWVNILEKATIKSMSFEKLYNIKHLYHFKIKDKSILEIKNLVNYNIQKKEKDEKTLNDIINKYCEYIIKSKIFNLNKYLDKQLTIEYSLEEFNIKDDNCALSFEELSGIYNEIVRFVSRNALKLYKEAYWYGLNDRVLERYR